MINETTIHQVQIKWMKAITGNRTTFNSEKTPYTVQSAIKGLDMENMKQLN